MVNSRASIQTVLPSTRRGQRRQAVATAELPTATDLPSQINAMNAVRKSLRGLGWDDAWIDGVVAEVRKGKLRTSVPQLEQNVRRGGPTARSFGAGSRRSVAGGAGSSESQCGADCAVRV